MQKRLFFLIAWLMAFTLTAMAQVTTSGVSGLVTSNNEEIIGATVTAVHKPSGTKYTAVSNDKGRYSIQGMRVGGPYEITISYLGHKNKVFNNVYLSLGQPGVYNANMEEDTNVLGEVTVTGAARIGSASNFRQDQIESAPTIDRNVYDVAKLSPLVSVSKLGGISIAGSNNRYNSFQIDGMVSNDVFGLAGSGTNGGQTGANPISMDAIEEIQVVASPFDVRQGGFTGGGINAITKSGTNEFKGSAYTYYNNQDFYGNWNQATDEKDPLTTQSTKVFGASLGGPIIKDKLFFFGNIEYKKDTYPTSYVPGQDKYFMTTDKAQTIADTYQKYSGHSDAFNSRDIDTKGLSVLGRIDWNINDNNKFAFRYQLNDSYKDVYGAGSKTYYFNNSGYRMVNQTNSFVAELNSHINNSLYNEARFGASFVRDHREIPYSGPVVQIDNMNDEGTDGLKAYIGTEYSSGANKLDQDIYTIEDNLSWYLGDHTLTFGTHNEIYRMKNLFLQAADGAYYYNTIADFVNDKPYKFAYNWTDEEMTGTTKWAGTLKAGQFGFYVQDKWNVSPLFNLIYGVRIDIPVCFNSPTENPEFNQSKYATDYGVRVGDTPSSKVLFSPRVGFRYFTDESHKTLIRGGLGMFTGRVPFVWISNAWNNTGMEKKGTTITTNVPQFSKYGNDAMAAAQSASGRASKPDIVTLDKNFKYPQVLRGNLAIEQTLPYDIKFTAEGLYSKTLNNVWFQNLALEQTGTVYAVDANTPASATTYYKPNSGDYYSIINLTNTNKGYTYSLSAKLEKSFAFGLDLMASYTFGHSYGVIDGTSSVAYSNWKYNYAVDPNNKNEVSKTMFDIPHKVIAMASYTTPRYGNGRWQTNITVTYNGFSGQRYSLTMNEARGADFNGDGQLGNTLLYIPTADELARMQFVDTKKMTAEQSRQAFESWIENNDYAKNHRGQYAERNSNAAPWENHFDLHIAQSFFYLKERGSKLELTLDVTNVANLLNKNWGTVYSSAYNETILAVPSLKDDGKGNKTPQYSFLGYSPNKAPILSRWHAQVGLRLTF